MRSIPSIEQLRQRPKLLALEPTYGRAAIVDALRAEAAVVRAESASGQVSDDMVNAIESGAIERLRGESARSRAQPQRGLRSCRPGTRTWNTT
jgi:Selenocysteine synthase N terminal